MNSSSVNTWAWRAVLSRRELIKLGIVAWIAPGTFTARRDETWRFIVCSDTHFGIPGTLEKNRALLEEMTRFAPELALIAGDITERAWAEEYDEVERGLAGLPFPVRAAPGNHDVRWAPLGLQIFQDRMGPPHQVFKHGDCGFVLLDTTVPLSHWGHVGGPQRRWLAAELEKLGRELPLFVFMHHPTGRDPAAVDDEDALADVLAPYNTKVIFTGHGHSDLVWDWRGITHTMGRGLYQGCYQVVEVDPLAGEVRLSRRTDEVPEATQFAAVPLARRIAASTSPLTQSDAGLAPAGPVKDGLRPLWQQSLGGGVMSHLLLRNGTLYVSAMDGSVSAFDSADGRLRWRGMTAGYCHSSPVITGNSVVVGSADGNVYCFGADTGSERWRFATHGPVYASAAIARGVVVIASGDGSVYGLSLKDGAQQWRWQLPPSPSAFSQSPAATDGERVFIGAWDRHVYALDAATGSERWRYEVPDAGFYYSPAIGGPALHDGRVYVPSNRNKVHALDAMTGELIWMQSSPGDSFGYSSPRVVGERIYIGCLGERGEVRCLATEDGHEIWATGTGATIYDSSPAIAAGALTIGSVNGTLWLLRAADGAIMGSHRFPPGHFLSSPAAATGRVYAATFSEVLMAFEVVAQK